MTEFLPVSSSAHLIIFSAFAEGKPLPIALNIALHMGTFLAIVIYFWRDWLNVGQACVNKITKRQPSFAADRLLPAIIVGSVPAAVVGLLWEKQIEAIFHHPTMTIIPLALIGILLWLGDLRSPQTRKTTDLTIRDGILIGVAQALALIPGTSRSGITILAGRLLTFKREDAARFSFLLGTPVMAGAVVLNLKEILASIDQPVFYIGTIVSALVGCLAIGFLLRFLKRFGFGAFALYRVVLAAVIWFLQ
jgi:undecaprenyl-diphosphatase